VLIQADRRGTTSPTKRKNCWLKPAIGFLRLSKKPPIDYTSKQLPDR
jgi:hypothetical protein